MAQVSCIVVDLPCQIGDQLYSLAQVSASKHYLLQRIFTIHRGYYHWTAGLQFDWIVFYQTRTLGLLFCECIKAVSSFPIKLETSHTVILPPTVSVVCLLFTWERFHWSEILFVLFHRDLWVVMMSLLHNPFITCRGRRKGDLLFYHRTSFWANSVWSDLLEMQFSKQSFGQIIRVFVSR